MQIRLHLPLAVALAQFTFCSVRTHAANSDATVFQIGSADGNYQDLALAGDYSAYARRFPHDVTFRVGQSDPRQAWPYIEPGPSDTWAGSRSHTFKILFDLPSVQPGYYRLVIDFVDTQAAMPPRFRIELNGTAVTQSLPPGKGDASLKDPKAGRRYTLDQLFPAALFRTGTNTLALVNTHGSWALYDDVRLESGAAAPARPLQLQMAVVPYLIKRLPEGSNGAPQVSVIRGDSNAAGSSWEGDLWRLANVTVNNLAGRPESAALQWKLEGGNMAWTGSKSLELPFGQHKILLYIPNVDQPATLKLQLRAGSRKIDAHASVRPTRSWSVYIIPTTHTDIGYTDLQKKVMARHAANTVRALAFCDQYPSFRWDFETYFQFDCFLRAHPDQAKEAFKRLRQGRMALAALFGNMLTGLCSHEALNRVTLPAEDLGLRHDFPVQSAILDDVPSAVGSLPMVLADAGIKYFIEGVNTTRAPYATQGLKDPFYWEGPDGSRVLAWISPGYGHASGLISSMDQARERLPHLLAGYDRPDYPYDAVLVNGAFSDNGRMSSWLPKVVRQWNAQWAYPHLILGKPRDFFQHIQRHWAGKIPVLKADFGSWWEDGAASTARATTLCRRAEDRAVTAEMLHSLDAVLGGAHYPKGAFDSLWRNILLYDEHTWGAWCSVSQPTSEQTIKQWAVKRSFARQADKTSRRLLESGLAELARLTPSADLVVFNPLAWSRDELVKTASTNLIQDVASRKILPCQALPEGGGCFLASDLPSLGYRTYRHATSNSRHIFPHAVQFSSGQMENEFYRIRFDSRTGALTSILDKQTGRELLDPDSAYGLGEVIYASGEGDQVKIHRQQLVRTERHNGPVYGEWDSEVKNEQFPHITMRVRLYRGIKRISLRYEMDKVATTNKEAVYIAFPFGLKVAGGGLWMEYPDAITQPLKDMDPSGCRGWFALQRWLAASDGHTTVVLSPLDTPLVTLGGLTGSQWPRHLDLARADVFAYVMNNYWFTNYKASQGGHFVFRFSLTSMAGSFSGNKALRRGWDMFSPPVARAGLDSTRHVLPAAESLLRLKPAGLPLLAFKQAEDRDGYVLRLGDFSGAAGEATLSLPRAVREAFRCNLSETHAVEEPAQGKSLTAPLTPFGLTTVKVKFQ